MEVDVAVIGSGPAGSTLAALLASRGHSVALVDRDTLPRDKLCGEFLSYDALPVVDALGVDLGDAPHIAHCRVNGSSRTYQFDFPHAARGISRYRFDDLLFRAALARGARDCSGQTATAIESVAAGVLAGHVSAREDAHRRTVTTSEQRIEARVVAGAWGRWGRFDQQLGRAFVRDRSHRNFGFKRHYRGKSDHETIELYSFRRGYLGVNAIEEGLTNICGLVHASRLTGHRGRWDSFVETIREEEPALERMYSRYEPAQDGFLSSEPVIFRARSPVEAGVFMIGDASGVIDPLTGNGMAMAVQSALVAAGSIDSLLRGADRARCEDDYRREHARMFSSRIRWSRRVAKLLSRPALLDAALSIVRSRRIGPFFLAHTRAVREDVARLTDRWFSLQ